MGCATLLYPASRAAPLTLPWLLRFGLQGQSSLARAVKPTMLQYPMVAWGPLAWNVTVTPTRSKTSSSSPATMATRSYPTPRQLLCTTIVVREAEAKVDGVVVIEVVPVRSLPRLCITIPGQLLLHYRGYYSSVHGARAALHRL
jgi:hypothetical protein